MHGPFFVQVLVGILEPELRVLRLKILVIYRLVDVLSKCGVVVAPFQKISAFCCSFVDVFLSRNLSRFKFCKAGPKMRREFLLCCSYFILDKFFV